MGHFDWVMSAGGALICLERDCVNVWGGILRLTIEERRAKNDYERTYGCSKYLDALSISTGKALIFGDGPLDTSFWQSNEKINFAVRVFACEPEMRDDNFDRVMRALDPHLFDNPIEAIDFEIRSSPLIMFDSANDGSKIEDKTVSVEVEPGLYRVLTQTYDPDPTCSLVLHRFDKLTMQGQ